MKKIVTIQDISCFGKCSLTVALPIISAMGIETAVIPTAVLSTHTGGFNGYTFRDLTEDIPRIAEHWKTMNLNFSGIYTGYLGSREQIRIVSDFFDDFGSDNNFIVVDPVMADFGRLYAGFDEDFVTAMRDLCRKADYIIPNMTEAAMLLGLPYRDKCDDKYARDILRGLAELGCATPILTGFSPGDGREGAAAYDSVNDRFYYSLRKHIDCRCHGTGDIFASVFTGAVTLGKTLQDALDISVNFTADSIEKMLPEKDDLWYGSAFELCIDKLIEYVKATPHKTA